MLVQKFSQESIKVVISADNRKRGVIFNTTLDATQEKLSDIEDRRNQCTINKFRLNTMQRLFWTQSQEVYSKLLVHQLEEFKDLSVCSTALSFQYVGVIPCVVLSVALTPRTVNSIWG